MKTKPQILCPITDWQDHEATRGRNAGKSSVQRRVIGADPMNWFIGVQTQGEDPDKVKPEAYFGSMRLVIPALCDMGVDVSKAVNNIIGNLVEKTGKEPEFVGDPMHNLETLGKWIDENFQTTFHKPWPPTVYTNIFKADAGEDEE